MIESVRPESWKPVSSFLKLLIITIMLCAPALAGAQSVKLLRKAPDPFGYPRPEPGAKGVALKTSIYFELGMDKPKAGDQLATATLAVTLQPAQGKALAILSAGKGFAKGVKGWIRPAPQMMGPGTLAVYIEPPRTLDPLTTYTVKVEAKSRLGAALPAKDGQWRFTTGGKPGTKNLAFEMDFKSAPVQWQGEFFSGFCKPAFCNSATGLEPSYEMMARDRKQNPRAWKRQRDFWLTGSDHTPTNPFWPFWLPNIVRELETRRIAVITSTTQSREVTLKVEDFFGHAQYGIADNRPLSGDYKAGDEVLIADGTGSARARIVAVDDGAGTVKVDQLKSPAGGWKIDDPAKYVKTEDPAAPGLFPNGGCYLRRFGPAGTPRYYWGRLDREWDIARAHGNILMPNFTDAPGDLSATGQQWTPPKDYAEMHEVFRAITGHIIERWGAEAALSYTWSIFNEPDLSILFWHGTQAELNRFYDYASDAVLRAFEDHGLDSGKVFIGGLELGAVFPNLAWLDEFLQHCSPHGVTTASLNAAFADKRLEGKRSRRVEELCRAHGGKGAPFDFVSIHAYNRSAAMAAKLTLAKDKALKIDADYYGKLWVCSHESAPDWAPPPDEAAGDVFMGNGYYPAWCADVTWRLLERAARDPRYAMGEQILTYFPWPARGVGSTNAPTVNLAVSEAKGKNGETGKTGEKKEVTVGLQLYGFLNQLGAMGSEYWVLPEKKAGTQRVAGFASRSDGTCRVMLYAQDTADVQSRGGQAFQVALKLGGLGWKKARVAQVRFDAAHNSALERLRELKRRAQANPFAKQTFTEKEIRELQQALAVREEKKGTVIAGEDGTVKISAELAGNGACVVVVEKEE